MLKILEIFLGELLEKLVVQENCRYKTEEYEG